MELSGCGVPVFQSWFSAIFLNVVVEVITLGLPPACKLWFGVSKGMIPVRHLAPKILKIMAVNYCGCQLDGRLTWVAPAYHKNEGATPHPGACMFGLQYDGLPDERFELQVETWNFGNLYGNIGKRLSRAEKEDDSCVLFAGEMV